MSKLRVFFSKFRFGASFWIIAILLLAAVLRITNAGHFPVWTDEGWSTWAISSYHLDTILANLAGDRHPPLYFLVLSAFSSAAGYSRIALRFVSIGAGLLIVALTYRIGREWFNRTIALFATLLIAVLPSAVYYAQVWGLTMVGLLMTFFFLRFLNKPRRSTAVLYAICVAIMFYTNYIGIFL